MARFIHYDENEDGTITFTSNVFGDDEVVTAVVSVSMDEMLASSVGLVDMDKTEEFVDRNMVRIPNDIEGADG